MKVQMCGKWVKGGLDTAAMLFYSVILMALCLGTHKEKLYDGIGLLEPHSWHGAISGSEQNNRK